MRIWLPWMRKGERRRGQHPSHEGCWQDGLMLIEISQNLGAPTARYRGKGAYLDQQLVLHTFESEFQGLKPKGGQHESHVSCPVCYGR